MNELELRLVKATMHYVDAVDEFGYDSEEARRRYIFLRQACEAAGMRL